MAIADGLTYLFKQLVIKRPLSGFVCLKNKGRFLGMTAGICSRVQNLNSSVFLDFSVLEPDNMISAPKTIQSNSNGASGTKMSPRCNSMNFHPVEDRIGSTLALHHKIQAPH